MNLLEYIWMSVIIILYLWLLSFVYPKKTRENLYLRRFYRAIKSIVSDKNIAIDEIYRQILMNYNKLYQKSLSNESVSFLDLLEQIIIRYDSYTDKDYKSVFRDKKDKEVRDVCLKVHAYVIEKTPFSNLPIKEATLLNNIKESILSGNVKLGEMALQQLSEEMESKDYHIKKQDKTNRFTTLLSILGLILTVFFGVLSLF